jgi:hypothetical protein
MAMSTGKKSIWQSCDVIPMPDTVIACVNTLGNDQPEQLIFTNQHGHPIGDVEIPGVDFDEANDVELPRMEPAEVDNVELPGVDMAGQDNPAPQIVEIDDLDIPAPNPPPVEVETVEQAEVPAVPEEPARITQPTNRDSGSTQIYQS